MFLANSKSKASASSNPKQESPLRNNRKGKEAGNGTGKGAGKEAPVPAKIVHEKETAGWRWEYSWAKEILREAIVCNDITENMPYNEIHEFHSEIAKTDRNALPRRVRALRIAVAADAGRAKEEALALEHDRKLFPIKALNHRGEERWEGSQAQLFLKSDIKDNKHLSMTPDQFYESRVEYSNYCTNIIRSHIYQEVKLQKWFLYRNEKLSKKIIKFST